MGVSNAQFNEDDECYVVMVKHTTEVDSFRESETHEYRFTPQFKLMRGYPNKVKGTTAREYARKANKEVGAMLRGIEQDARRQQLEEDVKKLHDKRSQPRPD